MNTTDRRRTSPGRILREHQASVVLTATTVLLLLFGDAVLPTLGHGLHFVIEIIELPLEHLLEWAFHLSPRQAQAVLAWSALFVVIHLNIRLVRYLYREVRRTTQAVISSIRHWKQTTRPTLLTHPMAALTLTVGLLGAMLFAFS